MKIHLLQLPLRVSAGPTRDIGALKQLQRSHTSDARELMRHGVGDRVRVHHAFGVMVKSH